jgi:hypothetical protein
MWEQQAKKSVQQGRLGRALGSALQGVMLEPPEQTLEKKVVEKLEQKLATPEELSAQRVLESVPKEQLMAI